MKRRLFMQAVIDIYNHFHNILRLLDVSCKIGQKAENIFLYASIKILENFDIKHLCCSLNLVK